MSIFKRGDRVRASMPGAILDGKEGIVQRVKHYGKGIAPAVEFQDEYGWRIWLSEFSLRLVAREAA